MKLRYGQILKGCIALIITVACLFVAQAVWRSYAVDLPLDKALKSVDGVASVALEDKNKINNSQTVNITLNKTANLQKTYKEISAKIEQTQKNKKYSFEIKDNRSPELEQAYYEMNFYIQKAIVDGDFPLLETKIKEKANSAGVDAKVYVDEQNIYLQLAKNDHFLYSVEARQSDKIGGKI